MLIKFHIPAYKQAITVIIKYVLSIARTIIILGINKTDLLNLFQETEPWIIMITLKLCKW